MIARATVVATAREWLGTRWQHQASLKGIGCDCIGLVVGVAHECGVAEAAAWAVDSRGQGYGRAPDSAMLLSACADYLDPLRPAAARAGDILLMRFAKEPQHFAFVSLGGNIIHAYAQARRVVEHRLDALWRSRIVGAYALRGVG